MNLENMKLYKTVAYNKTPFVYIPKILEGGQNSQSHYTQATGKGSTQEQELKPSLENLPIYKVKPMVEAVNPQTILNQELKDKVYDYHGDKLKPKDYQEFVAELLYDCESCEEGLKRKSIIKFCKNLMLAARKYQRPFDASKDYIINPNNI
jgi:uncharacterized circularly permuted ATP-grasp superfamily protein